MSEGIAGGGAASGANTPTSPNFDPNATDFVPKRTPATDGRTANGQLRASFNTMSGSSSSVRKSVRPALPMLTSSTWSPNNGLPFRSARAAPKPSWESLHSRSSGLNPAQSQATPSRSNNAGSTPGSLDKSPGLSQMRYTQTEEYHSRPSSKTASPASFVPRTAPLPQVPWTLPEPSAVKGNAQQHSLPTSSSGGSSASQQAGIPSTPASSESSFATQAYNEQNYSDEETSPASGSVAISDHYLKTYPEKAGAKGDVWTERYNPQGLRRALKDPSAEWEEAYPGALAILTCMNPETYQMPYGTRVINIKTEYPRNILLSLKYGKYAVMEKVAERIMKMWDLRANSSEKVLFLFSVNGSKKFCGVAEMSGPWERNDSIPMWEQNPESKPCVGTIPCIWNFCKDVGYHQFIHVHQPNNSNPVGNMWNGMNFASETGREVMEIFVTTPGTASILGHPRYPDNEGLPPPSVNTRRGGYNSRSHRGGRGDLRGGARGGHTMSQHWRQRDTPTNAEFDADQTPTVGKSSSQMRPVANDEPLPKLDAPSCEAGPSTSFKPGQTLSVVVNDQGKLEVIGIDAAPEKQEGSPVPTEGSAQRLRPGSVGLQGALHGARSLGSLHHSFSSTSTVQAQSEFSSRRLHPAVSMDSIGRSQHRMSGPDRVSPSPTTWPNGDHGRHESLHSPDGAYGSSSAAAGVGEDTPTHRPAPHGSRRGENGPARDLGIVQPSVSLLKARFHAIAVEQYSMQAQLDEPTISQVNSRVLNAKIARILVEKREVQAELGMMGVSLETLSPVRHDSFDSSTEPDSTSSASVYQISPVRAEDGRRLRSISKLDSPALTKDSGTFDKAPGSGRINGHKFNESWDVNIKKSIQELVNSPKQETATPARPAIETSKFFPENIISPCERRVLSFPTPREVAKHKAASPNVEQSSSFTAGVDQANGQSGQNSSTEDKEDVASAPASHGGVRLDS